MSINKSLLNNSFKDTIKMTLTSDGNLGVGLINPSFKITATGVIQAKSIYGYVLNDTPLTIGLDTWKNDTHLFLGQTADGNNTSFIQSADGDVTGIGNGYADTQANLLINPAGGLVGVGVPVLPLYPLHVQGEIKTNHIVRADIDFTTKTDIPGWTTISLDGPGDWDAARIVYYDPNANNGVWNKATGFAGGVGNRISYKIIGKTCFLSVRLVGSFTDANNNYTHAIGWVLPSNIIPKATNEQLSSALLMYTPNGLMRPAAASVLYVGSGNNWRYGPSSLPVITIAGGSWIFVIQDMMGNPLTANSWMAVAELSFELI